MPNLGLKINILDSRLTVGSSEQECKQNSQLGGSFSS